MKRTDNVFTNVQLPGIPSSSFDLSHSNRTTCNMGELIPVLCLDTLPGDRFNIRSSIMLRFLPMLAPVMHQIKVAMHFFYCPNRILWPEWEDWIIGKSAVLAPYFRLNINPTVETHSLCCQLGYPATDFSNLVDAVNVTPFPIAAYLKIWDDYYRADFIQDEVFVPLVAGDNVIAYGDYTINDPLKRAWRHDYFTSALPTPQEGDPISIPLTFQNNIPVVYDNPSAANQLWVDSAGSGASAAGAVAMSPIGASTALRDSTGLYSNMDPQGTLTVDIQSDAATITELRLAVKLQEWAERKMRGGDRYSENLLAQFNVRSSDARLQRSEYLGGFVNNVVISEVLQTSTASAVDPTELGTMAGHAISVGGGQSVSHYCEEWGWILGIMSVMPDSAYQDGLQRKFSRLDQLDYAWPTFANISEQPILNKEVMLNIPGGDIDGEFGYIPRYSEYKYENDRVAGDMVDSFDFWALQRKFDPTSMVPPSLNSEFIACTPSTRIFAVTDPSIHHIVAHIMHNINVSRKLPRYGIPSFS